MIVANVNDTSSVVVRCGLSSAMFIPFALRSSQQSPRTKRNGEVRCCFQAISALDRTAPRTYIRPHTFVCYTYAGTKTLQPSVCSFGILERYDDWGGIYPRLLRPGIVTALDRTRGGKKTQDSSPDTVAVDALEKVLIKRGGGVALDAGFVRTPDVTLPFTQVARRREYPSKTLDLQDKAPKACRGLCQIEEAVNLYSSTCVGRHLLQSRPLFTTLPYGSSFVGRRHKRANVIRAKIPSTKKKHPHRRDSLSPYAYKIYDYIYDRRYHYRPASNVSRGPHGLHTTRRSVR